VKRSATVKHPAVAKISPPLTEDVVLRRRLFRQIDDCRRKPVTWVSGPPGSGKTTLVSSYLHHKKIPCIWYQVDEGDADIPTFFYYMGLAAKNAAPLRRKPLPFLTPEYMLGLPTFTLRYFENFCSRLKSPHVIVFENYQQVPVESGLHELLSYGLSAIPANINVIAISRREPPPQMIGIRASNKMSFLGWNEIRFTLNESRELIRMKGYHKLSEETLLRLYEKIQGWAAGLVLLIETLKLKKIDVELLDQLDRFSSKETFDYFSKEIFNMIDTETQDLLLKTSFLPKVTIEIAKNLTGISRAEQILIDLNQRNFFTETLSSIEPAYQFHPLFRDFLLSCAKDTFEPSILLEIKKKAAALLEADGQIEEALALLHETSEWQDLIRLILQQAPSMIVQGRNMTLVQWLQGIPKDLIEKNPWLLYWLGVCLIPFSPEESKIYFEKAFGLFRAGKDSAGTFLSLVGMFEANTFPFDSFVGLDQLLPMLYEALNKFKEFPSEEIEASVVKAFLFIICLRKPQMQDAERWISRGLALAEKISDCDIAIQLLCAVAYYHIFSGELERAAQTLDLSRKVVRSGSATPLSTILLKYIGTLYFWLAGEFEENRKAVNEAIALANASGVQVLDTFLFGQGAAGALCASDIKGAKHLLQRMSSSLDRLPSASGSSFYHTLSAWEALLTKDLAHANMHADLAIKFAIESGAVLPSPLTYLIKAIVTYELQRKEDALKHISWVKDFCSTTNSYQTEFRCLLAEAQFAFDRGDEEAGTETLRTAMKLGKEHGYTNTFFWLPSIMARLCRKALEAVIEVEYVRHLIRKRNLIPDFPPYECEYWPWPIKIFTLGRFGLIKKGTPAESHKKEQRKPLSILKALIALGGREVDEARLADILWPEAEGDVATSAFATTLSRLRQLLGMENAIQVKQGKVTLDSRYCYVDAWAFERLVRRIEELWKESESGSKVSSAEITRLTDKAIAMYKGPFLFAEDEHWSLSCQERLRSKYLRLITRICQYLEQTGQCEKAVEYYQRALEIDNLTEEFYQQLMFCYQHLDQQAEAMKVYKRCRKVLSAVLGIEPSSKTEAMYKKIASDVKAQNLKDK
jgi:LuxR family maltose regulon positive regulatory protein